MNMWGKDLPDSDMSIWVGWDTESLIVSCSSLMLADYTLYWSYWTELLSVIKKKNYHKTSYADDFTLYWSDVKSSHSSYQWSFNKLWIQTVNKSELIQPLYHCNHWKQHTKITYPGLQDNTHYLWNMRNPPYTKFE